MAAQLVALTDGRIIPIDKGILVIGRHVECDIQILSPKVSRLHCCVAQVGDYLVVRDLNSTNGIRINGVRVMEGRLGEGDELAVGTYRYRVSGGGLAARAAVQQQAPLSDGKGAKGAANQDLESCEEPVALSEPAWPISQKNANDSPLVSIQKISEMGQANPLIVAPLVEPPLPVLEEVLPAGPPSPGPVELISDGDEVAKSK